MQSVCDNKIDLFVLLSFIATSIHNTKTENIIPIIHIQKAKIWRQGLGLLKKMSFIQLLRVLCSLV